MKVSLPDEELTRICGSTLAVELSLLKVDPIAEHVAETSKICQQNDMELCHNIYSVKRVTKRGSKCQIHLVKIASWIYSTIIISVKGRFL